MIKYIKITDIDMTGKRVRFQGVCLDKCDMSWLIHNVASQSGNVIWPIVTDIYWDSYKYSELKDELIKWISRYNNK